MYHNLPESVRDAISSGRSLSPPQIVLRLVQMVDAGNTSIADIARFVELDPGLCVRIFTAANTPALRRGRPLRTIEACLESLGNRLIRAITTSLSVQSLLDERAMQRTVDLSAYWAHSLLVAELSRRIAKASGYPDPGDAYLAGLLHDVGQLILISALGEPYLQILAACGEENALAEQETRHFGTHHGEIGTWLVDQWQLDSPFADGILYHHLPADQIASATALPQMVWLAHALIHPHDGSGESSAVAAQLFPDISVAQLKTLHEEALQRLSTTAANLSIALTDGASSRGATSLPRIRPVRTAAEPDHYARLTSIVGNKALLQALQQDLFVIEDQDELLLALRESARILFDLGSLTIVLCDPRDGLLSGRGVPGQLPLFAQISKHPDQFPGVVATAARSQQVCTSYDRQPISPTLADQQFSRALASSGLLCIPMIGNTRTVGFIVAGLTATQHARLSRRQPALANFGRIAGISLDDGRQAQAIREQTEEAVAARFTGQTKRIVHEAGNPLGILKGYLRILDGKLPKETDVRRELSVLAEEIERVSNIVQRMSEIPQERDEPGTLDIGDQLRELLLLYRGALFDSRGITIATVFPTETIQVNCDRDGIKQILLNLLKNAAEALVRGQNIRLSLTGDLFHQGNRYAELRMEDNGPGMSDAAMSVLHRPAADGRGDGGTRGLGLSIVGTLTRRLGIPVTCRSQPGQGTTISLLLPMREPADGRNRRAAAAGTPSTISQANNQEQR
ncbi:MAG TPA: HDOD domain-containing protein [Accumulibacter sp.]|jgi:HD-like signal output (HDOD) protein/signal transduction histidine kinase|nr:HDOD domain-containing protein [Accumulibacter sp.]